MSIDYHRRWRALFGILLVGVAYGAPHVESLAVQSAVVVPFHNGATVAVDLSTQDPNRLQIIGDRIAGVVCPPRRCRATVSSHDPSHSAYLTLNPIDRQQFTVHVSTLQQRYFSLAVTPATQIGRTVIFRPQSPGHVIQVRPHSESWLAQLTQLVQSMLQQQPLDGYAVVSVQHRSSHTLLHGLRVMPVMRYQGDVFTITHYQLTNKTSHWIIVHAPHFYRVGVVAVALSSNTLAPHAQTQLYQVTLTGGA